MPAHVYKHMSGQTRLVGSCREEEWMLFLLRHAIGSPVRDECLSTFHSRIPSQRGLSDACYALHAGANLPLHLQRTACSALMVPTLALYDKQLPQRHVTCIVYVLLNALYKGRHRCPADFLQAGLSLTEHD